MGAPTDAQFPLNWNIDDPHLIAETFSSRIWKVTRADGSPAIVKALKDFPDVWDELRGAHLLKWLDGRGAVRLFAVQDRSMLLEYAGKRHLSAVIGDEGDEYATEIAEDVLKRLIAFDPRPSPAELQPLADRFSALFAKANTDQAARSQTSYIEAAKLVGQLLESTGKTIPLHGDLHHDNILLSERGWVAIDPKGVLGDPAFDAANLFYNPLDRDDLCRDEARIAHMAIAFARALDAEPRRVLNFAIAYGHLSAAWHSEDGNTDDEQRELSIAAQINSVAVKL